MTIRTSAVRKADHRTRAGLASIKKKLPRTHPECWVTRQEAAETLGVHERTVDRYIRQHRLTTHVGPVPSEAGLANRVLIWKADVHWDLIGEHNRDGGE